MEKLDKQLFRNRWKSLIGLIALVLAVPFFVHQMHLFTMLILIGIYCIITIGLSLLIGYAGQISLGHAAFFGVGAYVSGMLTTRLAVSPWLAMLIGLVVTFFIAYLIGIPILKLKGHFLALATLAFNIIVNVLIVGLSDYTGGPLGLSGIPTLNLFGINLSKPLNFYYFIWTIVVLVILFSTNIIRSHVGRLLRSIHDSEIASQMLGVHAAKYKVVIFAISAALASLAGSLYAHFIQFIAPPTFGISLSILLLIMVMIGGSHSIWGAIVGTCVIMFLQEGIRFVAQNYLHVSGPVEIVVYGLIVMIGMIFAPRGILSLFTGLWGRVSGQSRKVSVERGE